MKKQLRIGAYLRVSTDKQVMVFEGSLDTQKYRMQEFVKNRNKEVKNWGDIVDFYVEEGFSAGTDRRPEYQRMMSDVRSGKINLILVSDISRLSRSVHDFSVLLKELERCNASYMSMKEQFDTTTPAGRLMINMVVNMAQFEREQISERVSINCNSRSLRGFVNGGPVGYGFNRNMDKSGVLEINEHEAKEIRTIFKIFKEQGSIGKTMPVVEALGILPRGSRKHEEEPSQNKAWTYSLMRGVLTNVSYVGLREVNKKNKNVDPEHLKPWQQYQLVKAAWPAIVDLETFNEVKKMLEENLKLERRRLSQAETRIFLLSGILTCGECGRPLNGQSAHGKYGVHRYYYHSYKRGETFSCSQKRIRADDLEQVVVNHLVEVASRAGYFEQLQEKLDSSFKESPKQIEDQILKARSQLVELEKEIAATFKVQLSAGGTTEAAALAVQHLETLGNRKKVLRKFVEDLEIMKVTTQDTEQMCKSIESKFDDFKKGFGKSSPATRRRLLRRIFEKLVLHSNGLDAFFKVDEASSLKEANPLGLSEGGKIIQLGRKIKPRPGLSGSGSDLTLLSGTLPNYESGWGYRTRTCE